MMEYSRRRLLGRAVLLIAWLYATFAAIRILTLGLVTPGDLHITPAWLKVLAILLGVALLALEGVWIGLFVRDLLRGEGSEYLLSRTDQGTARISLRAIRTSLLRRARELDEVIGVKVTVRRLEERRLKVDVAYTTTDDRNAILVSETIRKVLRERFLEIVKADSAVEVEYDVKIDGFEPGTRPPAERKREKEEPEPFTGPRYPID